MARAGTGADGCADGMNQAIILEVDYTFDDLNELNRAHAKSQRKRQWWLFLCIAGLMFAVFNLIPMITSPPPPPPGTTPPAQPLKDVCFSMLPYVLLIGAIVVITKIYVRRMYRRAFDEKNPLQRHHVIELSPDGVKTSEPFGRHEYRWEAFSRWTETANLLMVYVASNTMIPLPKRCFASPEQLEQCRGLLRAMIDTPRTAQQAFPVVPLTPEPAAAAPVLPIPPINPPPRPGE